MWISFTATRPFATKVYIGGINAISGEPKVENLATLARWLKSVDYKLSIQDYLVAGPTSEHQDWIDGIIKENGSVAQFVAMPQGSGDTVEEQISGQQTTAGLQIEVVRIKSSHYMTITIKTLGRKDIPLDVTPYTYIWEVKKMIQLCEGIPPDQQKLIFRCQEKDGSFAHHQIEDRKFSIEKNLQLRLMTFARSYTC
jgi:hypothetical protein